MYPFSKIEKKWREKWEKTGIYEPDLDNSPARRARAGTKKPFYNLMMFPYPSAEGLHIGNMYAFTGSDIYGRFKRMQGNDVFEPIGLDGFGIHSENYAIKTGRHPLTQSKITEKNFYRQLSVIGNGYAWNEKVETYSPDYYKWTQWVFLQMYKAGLVYRAKASVNWCPSCKTVLADEQVINGKCERCGTEVTKKELEQWFFKITKYAEKLLKNLEKIDWSENIKVAQKNWIGKSEGAELAFLIAKYEDVLLASNNKAKKERIEMLLKAAAIKTKVRTPADIGIDTIEVDEDRKTLEGNAEKKVNAYRKKVKMPVLSVDSGLFIKGKEIDPVRVKRNALAGADENKLSQKQISNLLIEYYRKIAKEDGGNVDAEWRDAWALMTPDGKIEIAKAARRVVLTDRPNGKVDIYFPIRSLYKPKATGKYAVEQNRDEELLELQPVTDALIKLLTEQIKVFTTRPDTIYGATYMVLAPEHKLLSDNKLQVTNKKEVAVYVKKAKAKTENERIAGAKIKTGIELKGIRAINPATKKEIPVWIADYVLSSYGTGAIMAVPAHDERDNEFAKSNNLEIRTVIEPVFVDTSGQSAVRDGEPFVEREAIMAIVKHWKEDKYIGLRWKKVDWETIITGGVESGQNPEEAAIEEIREETGYLNPKLVRELPRAHSKFFHNPKNVNRFAHFHSLYFELKNGDREEIASEEKGNHDVVWLTKKEMERFHLPECHRFAWNTLIGGESVYTGSGLMVNSGEFDGMDSEEAKGKIVKKVGGKKQINYHLRDWLISRQRYWGPPIPMIHCNECGWQPVPEKDLPVLLPNIKDFRPKGTGAAPLASSEKFYKTKCPKCGGEAKRETDVSDTFLDSAWYYLRYTDAKNEKKSFDRLRVKKWLPVDMYIGGAEHSVLHLLYSRFLAMAFKDMGILDFEEPFTVFRAHGLLIKEGSKMSKSKGNVVNPDEYIKKIGADAVRMYLMFLGPFSEGGDWRDSGMMGVVRFLNRVWALERQLEKNKKVTGDKPSAGLSQTIKKVTDDIHGLRYNTAIAELMTVLNKLEGQASISKKDFETFLLLLAPFAPFTTEELWEKIGNKYSIHLEKWPEFDARHLVEDTVKIVVQVNGKFRLVVVAPSGLPQADVEKLALGEDTIKRYVSGKPKRVIFVKDRLINFVV